MTASLTSLTAFEIGFYLHTFWKHLDMESPPMSAVSHFLCTYVIVWNYKSICLKNVKKQYMFVTSQRSLSMDYVKLFSITGVGCLSSFPSEILWEGRREDGVVLEAAATIPAYWAVVILKQIESMSRKGISHSCQTEDRGVPYGWSKYLYGRYV